MATDSRVALLTTAASVLAGVTDIGAVFKYMPAWRTAQQMEEAALVTLANGTKEHRFAVVRDRVTQEELTMTKGGSVLVTHNLAIELWVAAKMDADALAASEAVANVQAAAVMDALRDESVLSTGANYCAFADDGGPQEEGPMEVRQLHGVAFHVVRIAVKPREEVARA